MEYEKSAAIFFHPDFLLHDKFCTCEDGGRMELIVEKLNFEGLWGENIVEADMAPMKRLKDVHDEIFLNDLHKKITHGTEKIEENTPVMDKSFEIARRGAGGVIDAIDMVMEEKISSALCLTAMPGHFSGIRSVKGGSLINYAAVGAHFLTKKYCLEKTVIIDLDAAHFSGTQEIFNKRRDVLTISMHEYPAFPGTGHYSETGEAPARGLTVNIPVPSGYGDREYHASIREIIVPIVKQYEPKFIILCMGTNVLAGDSSFHLLLSENGFLSVFSEIFNLAKTTCKSKMITILEGGMAGKTPASAISKIAHFLLKNSSISVDRTDRREIVSYVDWYSYSKVLKNHFRKFWRI
ncbi:MAG: hypothetical protein HQM10_03330 [Candidatus Riflebacteria bacterium]|nr:hypothetical protein [Candidatus Riflebacteria bacterium]